MAEERDWATFYEQHKDDPDVWGEPEDASPSMPRGGLNATITVRLSPEEASAIRGLAKESGLSYSEIVRRAVRKFVHVRLAASERERVESEDWHDYTFSTSSTRTGALATR